MKFAILTLIIFSTLFLALTDPEWPQRDPVPEELIVAHSSHCAGCHGSDPIGAALVDAAGNDVSIYDDWRISMMSLAARDPFWRATLKHEVYLFPAAQAKIETTCLKCHAPLGTHQHQYDSLAYTFEDMLVDSLGQDGVSCSACHQQPPETFGTSHSGNIILNTERLLYGPYPAPFQGPMELYVGFTPEYTDLLNSSGVCAGCHTLITGTLDENGEPTGDMFVEQATYHEWLNSSYAQQGKECQNCHMPMIEDSVVIATGLKDLEKRSPFALHQFYGANTAMLSLMQDFRDTLGLSDTIPEEAWSESIQNNRMSLRGAAEVTVSSHFVLGDTLYAQVTVRNNTGHKLPSGYPSRVAWLQVLLTDDLTGDTIYANGMLDATGHISGRDFPNEPHHEIAQSADDVQIYEMVMSDVQGQLTTRLNAAYQPLKDNRLLPAGFRRNHAVYDTVAIWGAALTDPDYEAFSTLGQDILEYRIPLEGFDGYADLHVSLQYHTFPSRWMQDLFVDDAIAEIGLFKSMYTGYETFTELIDSVHVYDLDLGISSIPSTEIDGISVFPNPVSDGRINIGLTSDQFSYSTFEFQLVDARGEVIMSGMLTDEIRLTRNIDKGVYYLVVLRSAKLRKVFKLVVL